ncbi:MAG: PilZ domain-containing protein [Gammaproteobacteria bacterium]|nr:PilZ domain-containing protein [Gammaproteobacteria bacterium]
MEELEAYSDIKFSLALSLMTEQTSDIYGKVIKCDFKQDKWQVSIEFTAISSAARKAIKNYIYRIIQGV